MERSEALGGLVIALAALIVAVGIAVFVTAEGATPAQPPSGEDLARGESQTADARPERSRRERKRGRRAAPASRGRAVDDRREAARGDAAQTATATVVASAELPSAAVSGDADRWDSDDDYDDRSSGGGEDSGGDDGNDRDDDYDDDRGGHDD